VILVSKLRIEIVVSPCIQDNYRTHFSTGGAKEQGIFTLVSGNFIPLYQSISYERPDISLRLWHSLLSATQKVRWLYVFPEKNFTISSRRA
jgi:hypothetical protein